MPGTHVQMYTKRSNATTFQKAQEEGKTNKKERTKSGRRYIGSRARRSKQTIQQYIATNTYSNRPPSLWRNVWFNIRQIGKFTPRPITCPSISSEVLGFVDENEPCECRTRAMNGTRELFSNIHRILRHHGDSEGVASVVDAVFREPHKGF